MLLGYLLSFARPTRNHLTANVHIIWTFSGTDVTAKDDQPSDPVCPSVILVDSPRAFDELGDSAFSRIATQRRSRGRHGKCAPFHRGFQMAIHRIDEALRLEMV